MAKWSSEKEERWRELAEEAFAGMKEWRLAHPKAKLSEIEAALDERLARVRARSPDVPSAGNCSRIRGRTREVLPPPATRRSA
jgi:hypothetical protein